MILPSESWDLILGKPFAFDSLISKYSQMHEEGMAKRGGAGGMSIRLQAVPLWIKLRGRAK